MELRRNLAGSPGFVLDLLLIRKIVIPVPLIAQPLVLGRVVAAALIDAHNGLRLLPRDQGHVALFIPDLYRVKAWPHDNAHRVGFDLSIVLRLDRCLDRYRTGRDRRSDLLERVARVVQLDNALRLYAPFNGRAGGIHVLGFYRQRRGRLADAVDHLERSRACRYRNGGLCGAELEHRIAVRIRLPVCRT